jgi:glycosyltransferase involved in cell wall biosynthesis
MKFCFISPGYRSLQVLNGDSSQSGGAEAQVAHLSTMFVRLGHEVELIYGEGKDGSAISVINGVTCIDACPAWKKPRSLLAFLVALKRLEADIIYARLPDDFLWIAGVFSRFHPYSRFIYAIANDAHCNPWHTYNYKPWFHNTLYALGLRTADTILLQHPEQAQLIRPYVKNNLVLVPNLVRSIAAEARHLDDTDIDAVWIAQIRPQKQLPIFLDVVEQLPTMRFAVVGGFDVSLQSDEQDQLKKRLHALRNLQFFGPQPASRVFELLARSKVLVNTSSNEGFPNTMLEAWSIGVPVVSLTIDPSSVIQRENIGYISGTPAGMVQDITNLVQMYSLNQEMGSRGLAYVRKMHSAEAVCQAFEQIIPSVHLVGSRISTHV